MKLPPVLMQYFDVCGGTASCKVCQKSFTYKSRKYSGNLIRHLRNDHDQLYQVYTKEMSDQCAARLSQIMLFSSLFQPT